MSKNKLLLILFAVLLSSPLMAAPNVTVTVRAETVGQEIVYHYVMTRSGPEDIREFSIAVEPHEYNCAGTVCSGRYAGKLLTMPTGTTWAPDPYFNLASQTPTLSATATTQPPQWTAKAWGLRSLDGAVSEAPGGVRWIRTLGQFEGPLNPSAYVQQPTYNFSVRVPVGTGSTAEYTNGLFAVKYLHQGARQTYHAPITPAAPITVPAAPLAIQVPSSVNLGIGYGITWTPPVATATADAPTYHKLEESTSPTFSGCAPCPPGRFCAAVCRPTSAVIYSGPIPQFNGIAGKKILTTYYYRASACNSAGCGPPLVGGNGTKIVP